MVPQDHMPLDVEVARMVANLVGTVDPLPVTDRPAEREYVMASQSGKLWSGIRQEFIEAQAGVCAICTEHLGEDPNLDHCHQTGLIRGALCTSCNTKLGWYEKHRRGIELYLARSAATIAYRAIPRVARFSTRVKRPIEPKQPKQRARPPKPRLANGRTQAQDEWIRRMAQRGAELTQEAKDGQ